MSLAGKRTSRDIMAAAEEQEEQKHLVQVLKAFENYRKNSTRVLLTKLKNAKKLLFSSPPILELERGQLLSERGEHAASSERASSLVGVNGGGSRDHHHGSGECGGGETVPSNVVPTVVTRDLTIFKVVIERLKSHLNLINMNAHFLYSIIENQPLFMDTVNNSASSGKDSADDSVNLADQDKVKSTLKQFVRDWSLTGKEEREKTYNPILNELELIFNHIPFQERGKIKVLVPGAGLGRLVFEIVCRGFSCQGNEFSFFMLLASNYILNQVQEPLSIPIYPWIHQHSNMPSAQVQTAQVLIPDVLVASSVPPSADFSMVAGDFIEVYSEEQQLGAWDVMVTCFFIDTNKNFLKYLQVISKALKGAFSYKLVDLHFSNCITNSFFV